MRAEIFWMSPDGSTKLQLLMYLTGGSAVSVGILAEPFALSPRRNGVSRRVAFKHRVKLQRQSSFLTVGKRFTKMGLTPSKKPLCP